MGVEDRDWYRDKPSREWRRIWGKRGPRAYSHRRYRRKAEKLALPIAVAALCVLGWEYRSELAAATGAGLDAVRSLDDNGPAVGPGLLDPTISERIVRLGNRPGLDKPAITPTRWTLDNARLGHVEVLVPTGMTPRDVFRIELAQRGYQVVRG